MESASNAGHRKHFKRLVYTLASCCPIGPRESSHAAELCRTLYAHGIPSTIGKLSKSGDDPAHLVRDYQSVSSCLKSAADMHPPGRPTDADWFYLSVKPPALNFQLGHAVAIVETARKNGQGVHFDAHGFDSADAGLSLQRSVMDEFRSSPGEARSWSFGLTLPGRWKRSLVDARWAAREGVRPRLVKGDFPAASAFETDPRQGVLALVDLLAGEVPELAVATHDLSLAREALTRCKKGGTAVQLELFFGLPSSDMLALARELEVPVRFYVPYGDTLLVYLIRDLLTKPGKLFRRSSFELLGKTETKLARIIGVR